MTVSNGWRTTRIVQAARAWALRARASWGSLLRIPLAAVLFMALAPLPAWADDLLLSGSGDIAVGAVDVVPLPVECAPGSIQTGVSCGMTSMCGQDPCLCGSVDEWGVCACNGAQEMRPAWALSLGGGAGAQVGLVDFLGRTYLVSFGLGDAESDGVLSASLVHYRGAAMPVHVRVAPFGALDFLKVAVALAGIAGLGFALGSAFGFARDRLGARLSRHRLEGSEDHS